MIARTWRGWTAEESAARVAEDLRRGIVARYRGMPGNVSADVLRRRIAGGVEVMVLSVWDAPASVPVEVEERHDLLVARATVADEWELVPPTPSRIAPAAAGSLAA
jgi:hypothetical protein